jgi:hypothetical protein
LDIEARDVQHFTDQLGQGKRGGLKTVGYVWHEDGKLIARPV